MEYSPLKTDSLMKTLYETYQITQHCISPFATRNNHYE